MNTATQTLPPGGTSVPFYPSDLSFAGYMSLLERMFNEQILDPRITVRAAMKTWYREQQLAALRGEANATERWNNPAALQVLPKKPEPVELLEATLPAHAVEATLSNEQRAQARRGSKHGKQSATRLEKPVRKSKPRSK
jgi:hypothetical protein